MPARSEPSPPSVKNVWLVPLLFALAGLGLAVAIHLMVALRSTTPDAARVRAREGEREDQNPVGSVSNSACRGTGSRRRGVSAVVSSSQIRASYRSPITVGT